MEFECQCCFCGDAIAEAAANGHTLDPCAVIVIGKWKKSSDLQVEQQYFCHLDCFKRLVETHAPVELEELAAENL